MIAPHSNLDGVDACAVVKIVRYWFRPVIPLVLLAKLGSVAGHGEHVHIRPFRERVAIFISDRAGDGREAGW